MGTMDGMPLVAVRSLINCYEGSSILPPSTQERITQMSPLLIALLVVVGVSFLIGIGVAIYAMVFPDRIPELPWHT